MVQPSISNEAREILMLKDEITLLKKSIVQLEKQITTVQQNCKHIFLEVEGYRKCSKCLKVEAAYY